MKRNIKLTVIAFILLAFAAVMFCACSNVGNAEIAAECVRIHIRANSNEECDQSVKLKVRDAVTSYLSVRLEDCRDKAAALSVLEREKNTLTAIADKTLEDNGYTYKSRITLKNEFFPDRQYDSYSFPEGYYDALIIELGSGNGNNWWCVAFPPLCFIPESDGGEKIVYKSWIKEKLEALFG